MIYHTSCSDFISRIYPHEEMFDSLNNPSFFLDGRSFVLETSLARPSVFYPWGSDGGASSSTWPLRQSNVILFSFASPVNFFDWLTASWGTWWGLLPPESFLPSSSLRGDCLCLRLMVIAIRRNYPRSGMNCYSAIKGDHFDNINMVIDGWLMSLDLGSCVGAIMKSALHILLFLN